MIVRRRVVALSAGFALITAACPGDSAPTAIPATTAATGRTVAIVAQNTAFDVTSLDVTSGDAVTFRFDNRDTAIAHNLHVAGAAGGDARTEVEPGPIKQTLRVRFDQPGQFEYLCDVHPLQMRGTITVTGPPAPPT